MNEKRRSSFPSRRQFLQTSAAAVGTGLLLREQIVSSAYAAGTDETLRVGPVGCGGRGRGAAVQALTADRNARRVALAVAVIVLSLLAQFGWSAGAKDDSLAPGVRSTEELAGQGFKPLFDGKSLAGWDVKPWHEGHWVAREGIIDYDGKAKGKRFDDNTLWTKDKFGDFVLYVEWRLPAKPEMKPQPIVLFNGDFLMQEDNPRQRATRLRLDAGDSGILMRGILKCQANIWSQELGSGEINGYRTDRKLPQEVRRACIPIRKADRPLGEWNVFEITLRGDRMTVVLNGQKVIDAARLPDLPPTGPIGLQHHGDPVQFRRLFIKPLDL